MSNDRLEPFIYHNYAFKRCMDVISLGRLDRFLIFWTSLIRENWLVGVKWCSRHKPVGPNYERFWVFETGPGFLFLVQTGYFPVFQSPV